jgi:hypothetical protein
MHSCTHRVPTPLVQQLSTNLVMKDTAVWPSCINISHGVHKFWHNRWDCSSLLLPKQNCFILLAPHIAKQHNRIRRKIFSNKRTFFGLNIFLSLGWIQMQTYIHTSCSFGRRSGSSPNDVFAWLTLKFSIFDAGCDGWFGHQCFPGTVAQKTASIFIHF